MQDFTQFSPRYNFWRVFGMDGCFMTSRGVRRDERLSNWIFHSEKRVLPTQKQHDELIFSCLEDWCKCVDISLYAYVQTHLNI